MNVQEAALALVRAYDANVDAINGLSHEGEPHDDVLHEGPFRPGGVEIFDPVGDCAACGGGQYGTEDTLQQAVVNLKLALGEPLRGYEQHRITEIP